MMSTETISLHGLQFRENDGMLEASRTQFAEEWRQVVALPLDDYAALAPKFKCVKARFRMATVRGEKSPSGRVYVYRPSSCSQKAATGADVRQIAGKPPVQVLGSFRVTAVAVVADPGAPEH